MENNFKIIAIKAHTNCNDEFSKVLKKNELYYFYSDYIIIKEKKGERIKIKNSYPDSLYNIQGFENEINVNISAIVGRNGSGKSSIIELLFRGINNIACNFLYEKDNPKKTITANLKAVKGVHITFYYKTDWYYKITINNTEITVLKFKQDLTLDNDCVINDFCLDNFFYTEAVNYSHYAYNSREFIYFDGKESVDWLIELFHKNDSYQTPVVLNPMRTDGNFDINRENDLVKQRLLANLLRPSTGNINFRNLGDNLVAKDIEFKLKDKKEYYSHWITDKGGEPKERKIFLDKYIREVRRKIISKIFESIMNVDFFDTTILDKKINSYAEMYIIFKLTSICKKYNDYHSFFDHRKNKIKLEKLDSFIEKLKIDSSHITFKLKQTLNFLKNDIINFEKGTKKSIEKLSEQIRKIRKETSSSILELLPPPIFDVDILLENKTDNKKVVFSSLSSGEKQLIYMTSSLLYHLNNIDSVVGEKIKYKNINIILEEIELYFHPDLQKSFIKYFLDNIERLELKNIESINICFVTHSPFILSDIPSSNIMYLNVEDGYTKQNLDIRKSFGANIHEILMDNFFLNDGLIGTFSKNKIENIITWLNEKRELKNTNTNDNFEIDKDEIKFYGDLISIIDEPILNIKLNEMLSELIDDKEVFNNAINSRIKYLENLKK